MQLSVCITELREDPEFCKKLQEDTKRLISILLHRLAADNLPHPGWHHTNMLRNREDDPVQEK